MSQKRQDCGLPLIGNVLCSSPRNRAAARALSPTVLLGLLTSFVVLIP
jgi:hypothetical protein